MNDKNFSLEQKEMNQLILLFTMQTHKELIAYLLVFFFLVLSFTARFWSLACMLVVFLSVSCPPIVFPIAVRRTVVTGNSRRGTTRSA